MNIRVSPSEFGLVAVVYEPWASLMPNTMLSIAEKISSRLGFQIDSYRISPGRSNKSKGLSIENLKKSIGNKSEFTVQFYRAIDEIVESSPIAYDRYVEFSFGRFRKHLFIYDKYSGEGLATAVFGDLLGSCGLTGKYGFACRWDGAGGNPWGYAFGVLHVDLDDPGRRGPGDEAVADWGRAYFYDADLFCSGRLRNVYPCNLLSTREEENFASLIQLIRSDEASFGMLTALSADSVLWVPPKDKIDRIRDHLRGMGLLL